MAADSDAMQIDEALMHFESLPSELRLCCEFRCRVTRTAGALRAREPRLLDRARNVRGSNWPLEARAAPSLTVRTSNWRSLREGVRALFPERHDGGPL